MRDNAATIAKKLGKPLEVKWILDLRDFDGLPYSDRFTKNFEDILQDPEVKVVAEVMGGIHPAYEFTKALLESGKSVVTSNKALVAEKGAELLKIAKAHHVNYFFEASVGGGIPILHPMYDCLAANEIVEVAGILNGTTNFILTKMIKENTSFADALKMAQELGYAERDPSADVEGGDAARKISIMASIASGKHVYPEYVPTEGITNLTLTDVAYAAAWGGVIKLIGYYKKLSDQKMECMVCPAWISNDSQLAHVQDVFNAILVRGNAVGDTLFYGAGAGKRPTASAVVSDMIDAASMSDNCSFLYWEDSDQNPILSDKEAVHAYYMLFETTEKDAVLAKLGDVTVLSRENQPEKELAVVTKAMTGAEADKLVSALEPAAKLLNKIRVLPY
jgi:homoserine dehydrogenase